MSPFEFLSRISFFSILSWSFFFVGVCCALILTNSKHPRIRRYRSVLVSVGTSGLVLGLATWLTPLFLKKLNPDQSRLTPIHQLTITQWIEPVQNPQKPEDLSPQEIAFANPLGFKLRYKLNLAIEAKSFLSLHESTLVVLDDTGAVRGWNAYSGINHWQIDLNVLQPLQHLEVQKRLFILDRESSPDGLRLVCLDLQNPSVLWERRIPNSKDGAIQFDFDHQHVLVSAGINGIWALKAKTGEIAWKRPEIYSRWPVSFAQKSILAFEPAVMQKPGSWHFLEPHSGQTVQKSLHVYPDLSEVKSMGNFFLARPSLEQMFALNLPDLNPLWTQTYTEAPSFYQILGSGDYFLLSPDGLLEKRSIAKQELEWQKRIADVDPRWIRFSGDGKWFAFPWKEPETFGLYSVDSGDFVASPTMTEAVSDVLFLGDWWYILAGNRMWAFQK